MSIATPPSPPPIVTKPASAPPASEPQPFAILGEYDNVTDVVHGAKAVRAAGYTKVDVHSPFPIHGMDDILGIKPTILPWLVLKMGLIGLTTGFILTMYTMSGFTDGVFRRPDGVEVYSENWWSFLWVNLEPYQYIISGKPLMGLPGYIPVMFELTIMFAAYTAVFAMFLLNRLPRHNHPVLKSERFRRATQDRFFVAIEAKDRRFDPDETAALLTDNRALHTELVYDDED
ncbi:MAG: DUF3341 domain-containing protein [Planctomycetota bacterium]